MNRMGDNTSNVTDEQLDRLVDGELSEPQRRELLSGLDKEPEGWRRCALAFLAAQSWRDAMGAMLREPPETARSATPSSSPRRPAWLRRHETLLATAASFAVALVVGSVVRPMFFPPGGPAPSLTQLAADVPSQSPVATQPTVSPWSGQPAGPGAAPATPWRMVTVSLPDGPQGTREPIELPAVEQDRWNGDWLGNLPQALPPAMVQALQQSGRQVQQSRQLVPIPMEDGRRLVVPVDQIDIHYVGNRGYQ